ncbi:hypothetical protein ACO0RG_002425 [Hanseniaspora osmophila]
MNSSHSEDEGSSNISVVSFRSNTTTHYDSATYLHMPQQKSTDSACSLEKEFISYIASVVNEICRFKPHSLRKLSKEERIMINHKLNGRHNSKEFKLAVALSAQHPIVHLDYYREFDEAVGNIQGDKLVRKRAFTQREDQAHGELEKKYSPKYEIHDFVRCFKLLSKSDYQNMLKVIHAGQYIVYRTILKFFLFKNNLKYTNIVIPGVTKILNIEDISECYGISKYHFHRMFKSFTNVTIKEYETISEIFIRNHAEELQEIITKNEIFYNHGSVLFTMNESYFWNTISTMVVVNRESTEKTVKETMLDGLYADFNTNANNRASKKRRTANMVEAGVYRGNGRDASIYDQQVVTRDFRRGFFGEQAKNYASYDLDHCLSFGFSNSEKIPHFNYFDETRKLAKPKRSTALVVEDNSTIKLCKIDDNIDDETKTEYLSTICFTPPHHKKEFHDLIFHDEHKDIYDVLQVLIGRNNEQEHIVENNSNTTKNTNSITDPFQQTASHSSNALPSNLMMDKLLSTCLKNVEDKETILSDKQVHQDTADTQDSGKTNNEAARREDIIDSIMDIFDSEFQGSAFDINNKYSLVMDHIHTDNSYSSGNASSMDLEFSSPGNKNTHVSSNLNMSSLSQEYTTSANGSHKTTTADTTGTITTANNLSVSENQDFGNRLDIQSSSMHGEEEQNENGEQTLNGIGFFVNEEEEDEVYKHILNTKLFLK